LNAVRRFLRWRKTQPALQHCDLRFIDTPEPILAFTRSIDGQALLVAFNLSADAQEWTLPDGVDGHAVEDHGLLAGRIVDGRLHLPGHGLFYATPG